MRSIRISGDDGVTRWGVKEESGGKEGGGKDWEAN